MVRLPAILIVAVLGHALLMANGAELPHGPVRAAPALSVAAGTSTTAGAPLHQEKCFTVQTAIKSALPRIPATELDACPPGAAPDDDTPSVAHTAPPHHPPDTIRALLQVYRI